MILKCLSSNQRICQNLVTIQLRVTKCKSSSSKKTLELNVFDALKKVNLKEEVNPKKDIKTHENKKGQRETAFDKAFKNHQEGKETPPILEGPRNPTPLTNSDKRNVSSEENPTRRFPEPVKTNEPVQWKKRSFLALVDQHRETSKLFDMLKGVGTYSSSEESEDILVKLKPQKHEIHPSLLPEDKKPPALLDQLTDRYLKS